jgi:tRNA(adenine34) deaminase
MLMGRHVTQKEIEFMTRAIELARSAESKGNLPIGAVIVEDGRIIAEGENRVLYPSFHPGRHAEIEALNKIPGDHLHNKSKQMILYTTHEPCVMCLGSIVLHRIGKVVFGGIDPNRGASYLVPHLEKIYLKGNLPEIVGPVLPEICDALFKRADEVYRNFRDAPNS